MKARPLLWIIFLILPLASWELPSLGGFRITGWIWVMMSVGLSIFPLRNLLDYRSVLDYLLFLAYALGSIVWLEPDLRQHNIQEILQLGVPLLAWGVARYHPPGGEAMMDEIPSSMLISASALLLIPALFESLMGIHLLNANGRPGAITTVLIAACALALVSRGEQRAWFAVAMAFAYCFFTGSRTATFSIISLALIAPTQSHWGRGLRILAVVVVLVLTFSSQRFQERFFAARGEQGGDVNDLLEGRMDSAGRFELWELLWKSAQEHPIQGQGAGSASYECWRDFAEIAHPHNDYLRLFFDYGILGFLLFWSFFLRQWLASLKGFFSGAQGPEYTLRLQIFLSLSSIFIMAATDSPMYYTVQLMFPLFFMMGLRARHQEEQNFDAHK